MNGERDRRQAKLRMRISLSSNSEMAPHQCVALIRSNGKCKLYISRAEQGCVCGGSSIFESSFHPTGGRQLVEDAVSYAMAQREASNSVQQW
jgi:hypothetical protein